LSAYDAASDPKSATAKPALYANRRCRQSTKANAIETMVMVRASPKVVSQLQKEIAQGERVVSRAVSMCISSAVIGANNIRSSIRY